MQQASVTHQKLSSIKQQRNYTWALLIAAKCCLFIHCSYPESDKTTKETSDTLLASHKEILLTTGKALFKEHCAACHGTDSQAADPDFIFTKLFERLPAPSQDYFLRFVWNSDELLKEKDPYFMERDSLFSISIKHQYKDKLSEKELKAIMAYLLEKNKESSY